VQPAAQVPSSKVTLQIAAQTVHELQNRCCFGFHDGLHHEFSSGSRNRRRDRCLTHIQPNILGVIHEGALVGDDANDQRAPFYNAFLRTWALTELPEPQLLRYCSSGWKFSRTICRIPVRPFDYMVKAGQPARPKTISGEGQLPQYLVAGYLPDDFDPSQADEATGREIHALNKEMIAAGVRKFACGLGSAKSLRAQTDGGVLITDGPYLETKEHIGGF